MKTRFLLILVASVLLGCSKNSSEFSDAIENKPESPIQLHPKNPHYFQYKGKTMVLVTSAEHYGAVLNLDFDFKKYLETLSADGMNYTRIFTGTYFEIPGESFGIQFNSLAPEKGRVITPWGIVVSDLSGDYQYDLSTWNETYFNRLREFVSLAAEKDIIVEVTLFSSIYRDQHWDICPENPANNINISHEVNRLDAHTLNNGTLFKYQSDFVRKMVQELNEFNNVFFEIQNEPWADRTRYVYNIVNKEDLDPRDWTYKADFGDAAAMAWQDSLASIIAEEENSLPFKHLIAQNFTNFRAPIPVVSDHISIINFHYAWPDAVEWNYHYNKVIGFDESGFAGSGDQVYRRQAWQFMLSGGSLFNNLDYSFYPGNEDGLGKNTAPGGGGATLRKQLRTLSVFLHDLPLENMSPDPHCISSSAGLIPYVLSDGGDTYGIFLRAVGTSLTSLSLKTGDGIFQVTFLNTITGDYLLEQSIQAKDGILPIIVDIPDGELALRIKRK